MRSSNLSFALNLAALALGMLMLAYAAVPLYRIFCAVTGYGGTTAQAGQSPRATPGRRITVTFNADTEPGMPWEFKPGERAHTARIGEQTLTYYLAYNRSGRAVTGRAAYNVVPHAAGKYFTKVECFCFTEQTLGPKQRAHMPVSFFIDPAIQEDPDINDIKTITLSYTFFEVKK